MSETTKEKPKPKLSEKQRLWAEFYVGEAKCNASVAARMAGYADPGQAGYENKKKQEIQDYISGRVEAAAMGADEVLRRLAEHARGSFEPFLVEANGALFPDLTTGKAKENMHLLKKAKFKKRVFGQSSSKFKGGDELGGDAYDDYMAQSKGADVETEVEIELHDSQAALVHLGRHHKLFTDKQEVSGPNGEAVPVAIQFIPYVGPNTDNS